MAPQGALQRFFHTIREYSGLEGTFKGYLIQLVWFWSQGRGRCQSWVGEELGQALAVAQQSQRWGLWVKPGLGLILNPTGNELRKGLWFKHIPGCLGVCCTAATAGYKEQSMDGNYGRIWVG